MARPFVRRINGPVSRDAKLFSVTSYSPSVWHDFFMGTIGASAALTGLLFVAISINLEQILKYPQLPGRAAVTLGVLVSALVVSGFGLAPGQSNRALGIEIAAAGAVVAVQALWVTHGKRAPEEPEAWVIEHLVTLLLPSVTFVIGGVSLAVGEGGGLYWVLAAILFAFVSASINGWVLLVEIKR
jgi:hypothetical protein